MKTYRGSSSKYLGDFGHTVYVINDGKSFTDRTLLNLSPSLKLRNHSPTGFSWGYGGSGPAQLALALLLDATNIEDLSLELHQPFKWEFVAKWGETWEITSDEILKWVIGKQIEIYESILEPEDHSDDICPCGDADCSRPWGHADECVDDELPFD